MGPCVLRNTLAVLEPCEWRWASGSCNLGIKRWGKIGEMIVGVLEVFEANGYELFRMAWGSGVFVDVCDDEFQVSHWSGKSVEFRLQQVELASGRECLVKVGDLWQLIHRLVECC